MMLFFSINGQKSTRLTFQLVLVTFLGDMICGKTGTLGRLDLLGIEVGLVTLFAET